MIDPITSTPICSNKTNAVYGSIGDAATESENAIPNTDRRRQRSIERQRSSHLIELATSISDERLNRRRPSFSGQYKQQIAPFFIAAACLFMLYLPIMNNDNNHNKEFVPFSTSEDEDKQRTTFSRKKNRSNNLQFLGGSYEDIESTTPRWYSHQLVDHFDPSNTDTFETLYFRSSKYFGGPGHPIFVILGGEGPQDCILYPYISEKLAMDFNAFVLQTEHRFYGQSQPLGYINKDTKEYNRDPKLLEKLLTPEQAMEDNIAVIRHIQKKLKCSLDKNSTDYCPVMTVGGSYPGYLSLNMRFVHPDVVDIGYASSAPLKKLAASDVTPHSYFKKVTEVAEDASPGCAAAVKSTLYAMVDELKAQNGFTKEMVEDQVGICWDTLPAYIGDLDIFITETTTAVGMAFADFNMDYYPPHNQDSDLIRACKIFQQNDKSVMERIHQFFMLVNDYNEGRYKNCYDSTKNLPAGPNATISGADWTGMGDGDNAMIWEFQTCKDIIIPNGFYNDSMFYEREWTLEWLTSHCESRFNLTPEPGRLRRKWGYDHLVENGASRIIMTNGLNDGWSVESYLEHMSDDIIVINFPNGSHHSDLRHVWPQGDETEDVNQGQAQIDQIIRKWLRDIKMEEK